MILRFFSNYIKTWRQKKSTSQWWQCKLAGDSWGLWRRHLAISILSGAKVMCENKPRGRLWTWIVRKQTVKEQLKSKKFGLQTGCKRSLEKVKKKGCWLVCNARLCSCGFTEKPTICACGIFKKPSIKSLEVRKAHSHGTSASPITNPDCSYFSVSTVMSSGKWRCLELYIWLLTWQSEAKYIQDRWWLGTEGK